MDSNITPKQPIEFIQKPEEGVILPTSPLTLELKDTDVVKTVDQWHKDSRKFFKDKYNLYERRQKMETIVFGRQISDKERNKELRPYESRFLDNVIYEIEASLKPLAMSKLPDMIVTPGNDSNESRKTAEDITKCIDTDIKKRANRQVLGLAFKHLPVYFTGVIKVRWDPEINDIRFEVIHPDYIDVDHTCNTKNADDMKWISQTLPISVQECFMRFPKKVKDLKVELRKDGIDIGTDEEPKTSGLLSEIKIREIWFDWYIAKEDEKWEKISCVMWKYKDVVLDKMKNPNYDYKGQAKYYSMNPLTNDKREVTAEEMQEFAMTGMVPPTVTQEQIYRNFLDKPCKPFFFLGYDQWGKIPYDETSRIEQNSYNQENLNKRGKSIVDKLSARIKHIFSKDGGLKKDDIEQMDLNDSNQDILIEGDVNKVHSAIVPEQPTTQDFKDLGDSRDRMYAVSGATAIRGQMQSDVATTNQIAREGNFTRADDLVEDTINDAFEWMSRQEMHFIKLRYTEDHFKKLSGTRGTTTFIKLNGDLIEDGMEVTIKASGTDKLKTEKMAMEMAGLKMIDPLNFYRDIDLMDPEGRTMDLLMFTADPASYMAKVKGLGENVQQLVNTLQGQGNIPTQQPNQGMPVPSTTNPVAGSQPPSPVQSQGQPSPSNPVAAPAMAVGPPANSPRAL
jgi:hypothetical protein